MRRTTVVVVAWRFLARKNSKAVAGRLGYPVMVRPSYVLGGRAMEIVYSENDLERYTTTAVQVDPEQPVRVDKYLNNATELDVDALADKDGNVVIGGIMEHIEEAGVHSGDSACSIPPQTLSFETLTTIREWTPAIARALDVVGLINIQYAVHNGQPYIIEANPRASRTVPFVSKAIGHPLAKYASLVMSGRTLPELGFTEEPVMGHVAVKEAVLPFDKFAGADTLLGPEMRSTGEVMGIDGNFDRAYAKALVAAGMKLPEAGSVFISLNDQDKPAAPALAKALTQLGFSIVATRGTCDAINAAGIEASCILKLHEGRPHGEDMIQNGDIQMCLITPAGDEADARDGLQLRRTALAYKIPLITTVAAARAAVNAMRGIKSGGPLVTRALQRILAAED